MKNIILSFIIIAFFSINACSPKLAPGYNGEVNYISTPNKGTVTVRSLGYGWKKGESYHNAKSSAFYVLFFRGLPGSDYKLPLIADENSKKDDPFVKSFLDGGYTTFITSAYTVSEAVKSEKMYQSEVELTINYDALRKHLEDNKVTRKFGF